MTRVPLLAPAVLGIDQSWTGYAVVRYFIGTGAHDHWLFKVAQRGPAGCCEIRDRLEDIFEEVTRTCTVTVIAMEGYGFASNMAHMAGEVGGITKLVIGDWFRADRLVPIPPPSLKKFVTGNGAAKKQAMIKAVYKKWDVEFPHDDDNLADAYALARLAAALHSGTAALAYESDVLKKLQGATT